MEVIILGCMWLKSSLDPISLILKIYDLIHFFKIQILIKIFNDPINIWINQINHLIIYIYIININIL